MNNHQNPLRLNVGYLYNKPIGTTRDIPIDFEELRLDDLEIRDLVSLVSVSKTREGLLLQVKGTTKVETICVRCLEPFFLPVEMAFEELFEFPSRYREETDLLLPDDGYIDLRPLYREYLILSIPMKPLCKTDCLGLCVICGANLNEDHCEHHPELAEKASTIKDEDNA